MRSLALLGLVSLGLGYCVPIASAAMTVGGDRWVLAPVTVPSFAHPQFEDGGGAGKAGAEAAVPDAPKRAAPDVERQSGAGASAPSDSAAPAASGDATGTAGERSSGATGGAAAPVAGLRQPRAPATRRRLRLPRSSTPTGAAPPPSRRRPPRRTRSPSCRWSTRALVRSC